MVGEQKRCPKSIHHIKIISLLNAIFSTFIVPCKNMTIAHSRVHNATHSDNDETIEKFSSTII